MKKIALSLLALSVLATGAFASQRNNDEPNARKFIDRVVAVETTNAIAVNSDAAPATGSAFELQSWNKMIRDAGQQ